jgi:uncharacterized membrane protein YhaH (DUF805 family)
MRYWDGDAWTDQVQGGSEVNTTRRTTDERKVILAQQLQTAAARGLRIESQSEFQAVLVEGKPVNHVLHAILTIFTCLLWGIVWAIIGECRTGRCRRGACGWQTAGGHGAPFARSLSNSPGDRPQLSRLRDVPGLHPSVAWPVPAGDQVEPGLTLPLRRAHLARGQANPRAQSAPAHPAFRPIPRIHRSETRVNFGEAVSDGFSKYATFSGRSSRSALWWFSLFSFLVFFGAIVVDSIINVPVFFALSVLALFIPNLALLVRRLHDQGQSGWMALLTLLPFIGSIVFIVFGCMSSEGPNKYGRGSDGKGDATGPPQFGQPLPPPPAPSTSLPEMRPRSRLISPPGSARRRRLRRRALSPLSSSASPAASASPRRPRSPRSRPRVP